MTWLLDRYERSFNYGTYVCRQNTGGGGLSLHAEGRAGDVGLPYRHANGYRIRDFLIENAEVLGVQEVIWDRQIWTSGRPYLRAYSGPNPHTDHVHYGLCWWSARSLTYNQLSYLFPFNAPAPTPPEVSEVPCSPVTRGATPEGVVKPMYIVMPNGKLKSMGSLDEVAKMVNVGLCKAGPHYQLPENYFDAWFGNPPRMWP
jgi:hypothetical protein